MAFTDGSCLGNPGPCGSGACIFVPNKTEPVVAILMALEFGQSEHRKRQIHGITIFSDCQSAVGILTLGWTATSRKKAAEDTKLLISDLEKSSLEININGHLDMLISEVIVLLMNWLKKLPRKQKHFQKIARFSQGPISRNLPDCLVA